MTSHFGLMLLFAFFVSLIFATIAKDTPAEQAQARRPDVRDVHRRRDRPRLGDATLPVVISLWRPVAVYMAAIYYGAALTQVPGPVAQVSDTVLHMGAYAGLALLTLRATAGGRWSGVTHRAMALALVIATVHGISVEVEQMFVPTRCCRMARRRQRRDRGACAASSAAWAWGKLFKE